MSQQEKCVQIVCINRDAVLDPMKMIAAGMGIMTKFIPELNSDGNLSKDSDLFKKKYDSWNETGNEQEKLLCSEDEINQLTFYASMENIPMSTDGSTYLILGPYDESYLEHITSYI